MNSWSWVVPLFPVWSLHRITCGIIQHFTSPTAHSTHVAQVNSLKSAATATKRVPHLKKKRVIQNNNTCPKTNWLARNDIRRITSASKPAFFSPISNRTRLFRNVYVSFLQKSFLRSEWCEMCRVSWRTTSKQLGFRAIRRRWLGHRFLQKASWYSQGDDCQEYRCDSQHQRRCICWLQTHGRDVGEQGHSVYKEQKGSSWVHLP